jgi:methyl-accepting chemotaxis protein
MKAAKQAVNLRLRITHKIAAIGVTGILGLAIVGGVYLSGSWTRAQSQRNAEGANTLAILTSNLSVQMLEARRAEKNFMLRHDDRYAKNHDTIAKAIAARMDDIRQRLAALNQTELAKELAVVRADYDIYLKLFRSLVDAQRKLGLTVNDGLQGALRKSVDDAEAEVKKFSDPKLEAGMLAIRGHERDYMLYHDEKYVDELKDAAISFDAELYSSTLPEEYRKDISKKLQAYQRDFLAYMNGSQAIIRITKVLGDSYTKIDPQIVAIEKASEALRDNAIEAANATATATALKIKIAIGVAGVGVILLGFFIGRSIARPLTAMTAGMAELAKGNFSVVLPGLGRQDEIGDIAKAVETFKIEAAEKAQRTAEEQAEQAHKASAEREATRQNIATEFEAAVGGIVKAAVAGDFSQRVDLEGKAGLVLHIGSSINTLCETTGKALDDLAGMMGSLANGDLSQRIAADYQGMFGKLKDNANAMADRIGDIIGEIKSSAGEVTNASAEISASTTDLSQRTEEQAASLEETSASMEEIAATVKKNAENAQAANQSAGSTRQVADRGGKVVARAVEAMAKIEESSRKISDIIGVIDEIARQTNLLALNAAVEAARAGDAGRGFAVVASEVRSLAQRSSQAAKDIKNLITNSNDQVKDGVDLVNKAGTALTEIVESIKAVASIVADIADSSAEQASGIEQVNKALTQMDEVTQQNSALVEENAATAKTLEQLAMAMDDRITFFKLSVSGGNLSGAPVNLALQTFADTSLPPTRGPAAVKQLVEQAPSPTMGRRGGSVRRMQAALAAAEHDASDWKEF